MSNLVRDAPFGQLVRWASKGRLFQYPEDQSGFQCPPQYLNGGDAGSKPSSIPRISSSAEDLEKQSVEHGTFPFTNPHSFVDSSRHSSAQNAPETGIELSTTPSATKIDAKAGVGSDQGSYQDLTTRSETVLIDWYGAGELSSLSLIYQSLTYNRRPREPSELVREEEGLRYVPNLGVYLRGLLLLVHIRPSRKLHYGSFRCFLRASVTRSSSLRPRLRSWSSPLLSSQ